MHNKGEGSKTGEKDIKQLIYDNSVIQPKVSRLFISDLSQVPQWQLHSAKNVRKQK